MSTIWDTETGRQIRPLSGDVKCDAVVVGGGLCGVLTAYKLKCAGLHTVLLEAKRIGGGQSAGTTAKITLCHDEMLSHIENSFGTDSALAYAECEMFSIDEYERIVKEENIQCSFKRLPAYLYSLYGERRLMREFDTARRCSLDCEITRETELPFEVALALKFDRQAQFDPINFMKGILHGFEIYENTRALYIDGNKVVCDGGSVFAKHVVVATNYPFEREIRNLFPVKLHREMAHVCTFGGYMALEGMYIGTDGGYNYRSFGSDLIVSGESHVSGKGNGGAYERIRKSTLSHFRGTTVGQSWSAEDCKSLDGIPYVGQIGTPKGKVYVATGFGTWGMTTSMTAANLVCDLICGRKNACEKLYSPSRLKMNSSADSLTDSVQRAVEGVVLSRFKETKETSDIPKDFGMIVRYKGKKSAVYKDKNGELHVSEAYCPHMRCQLSWNDDDKTWDCPCHGSRFDFDGNLISGPSEKSI
ncbi:MAG: FAD-dependent oxidoreductase [Clostridia bacterium]|nr:FAD-dependent oxidoreductase [Clostridia bacterium]